MSTSDPSPASRASLRRRQRKTYALLVLAAGLLFFSAATAGLYYVLRPVTLRIAVGPPGSDDQKLVQALAQTFARDGSPVRLTPITTEGASESIALLAASKADLAIARGDLDMPGNAESVAILRKNVVVLWTPSGAPAKGAKKPLPKIKGIDDLAGHHVGVIGRTQANVVLLRVILTESGVNPDKVAITQFATNQITEMTRDPAIDTFMRWARSTARSPPKPSPRLPKREVSQNSCRSMSRTRSPRNTRSMNPRKFPAALSARR